MIANLLVLLAISFIAYGLYNCIHSQATNKETFEKWCKSNRDCSTGEICCTINSRNKNSVIKSCVNQAEEQALCKRE